MTPRRLLSGRTAAIALVLALGIAAPAPASAQITDEPVNPLPDPDKFARGFFADAEMGSVFFLGAAHKALGYGVAFGARFGYEFFRWVALQVHAVGSTHRTDFGAAPQSGQLIQLYQSSAELRFSIPIGRVSILGFGGAGIGYFSTNLLETTRLSQPDSQTTLLALGGGGVDYHTLSRHFSFGITGAYCRYLKLEAPGGVIASAYLRHTF